MKHAPTTPTLLLAMLLLVALFVRAPADEPDSAANTAASNPAPETAATTCDLHLPVYRLLARHYGIAGLERSDAAISGDKCTSGFAIQSVRSAASKDHLRVVIASVPDPLDSDLAAAFDAQVDALTRAAAARDYRLESWALPWSRGESSDPLPDLGQPSGSAAADANATASDRIAHRLEPGAILYARKPGLAQEETARVLLVLLVGEAPTFGVHPSALSTALDLLAQLRPSKSDAEPVAVEPVAVEPIPVAFVGPTFSGSAGGLQRALSEWANTHCGTVDVYFLTGSATAPEVIDVLKRGATACVKVDATRTIHSDDVLETAFGRYLEQTGGSSPPIAYLSERTTAYGTTLGTAKELSAKTEDKRAGRQGRSKTGTPLRLTFPLHISQLRAASARGQSTDSRLATPLARTALELEMGGESDAIDVLPPYAARQSANTGELELASTFDALRRRDIRYVVLGATDTRDQLFLAQLLRHAAPDVHLVSFESDVLYNHPRFSQDMLGALVVSTYPLTAKLPGALQRWTASDYAGRQDTFSNGTNEGTYRAALLAIEGTNNCSSGGRSMLPCAWMFGLKKHPPVWVSAIGRDAAWPIWVSAPDGARTQAPVARARVDARRRLHRDLLTAWEDDVSAALSIQASTFFRIALLVLALVCGFQGCVYLRWGLLATLMRLTDEPRARTYRTALEWLLKPLPDEDAGPRRRGRLFARCGLFAMLLAMVAVPGVIALEPMFVATRLDIANDLGRLVELFALFVAAFVLVPAFADACVCAVTPRPPASVRLLTVLVAVLSGVLLVRARCHGVSEDDWYAWVNRLLFSMRATHLESGLSPITPLFLLSLGLLILFVVETCRAQLLDRFTDLYPLRSCSRLPDIAQLSKQLTPFAPLAQIFVPASLRPSSVIAFTVLVAVPAGLSYFKISFALDSSYWRVSFYCGAVLLMASIALSMFRFLSVWLEMRKLMRALSASPLRDAFGRLPIRLGRTVGFEPSVSPTLLLEAQYSLDQLELLGRWFEQPQAEGAASPVLHYVHSLDKLRSKLKEELATVAQTHRRIPAYLSDTQAMLSHEVSNVLPALEEWWNEPLKTPAQTAETKALPVASDSKRPMDALARAQGGLTKLQDRFWYELAEEFVAVQTTAFLSFLFVYLRAALLGMTAGLVLLMLAMTSYPFEPQVPVLNALVLVTAVAVVTGWITLRQGSRSALLSLLQSTTPNEVTWNMKLAKEIFTYVGIPVLAALAAQMPALGHLVGTLFSAFTAR